MTSNRNRPAVTVLMAAYNAEAFLAEAVESVLAQTFTDFEFLIVEDGSTDATPRLLREVAERDERVTVLWNEHNLGMAASLNRGLDAARAPLIARLDSDDVAEPERLRRQIDRMAAEPDLDLLATWTTEIDPHGNEIGEHRVPGDTDFIRWAMTITNVLYHPTVMVRTERLRRVGGYFRGEICADDYELFTRLLIDGGRAGCLEEKLVRYRRSPGQTSSTRADAQQADLRRLRVRYVEHLTGTAFDEDVLAAAAQFQVRRETPDVSRVAAVDVAERVRVSCVSAAGPAGKVLINARARQAYLHHAGTYRRAGQWDAASRLIRAAGACGGRWRRSVLAGSARLELARLAGRVS